MIKQRYEYTEKAKAIMQGKYVNVIVLLIIVAVINGLFNGSSTDQTVTFFDRVLNILSILVGAGFAFGLAKMFMGLAHDVIPDYEDILLVGFKTNYVRNLLAYFLQSLFILLWSLLLIIPGIIKMFAYSMTFYILNKEESISGQDAITKSKELMEGHKSELFMLFVSYLGWYILGLFTFGILWLWVYPKHQTAKYLMFDDIYGVKEPVVEIVAPVQENTL